MSDSKVIADRLSSPWKKCTQGHWEAAAQVQQSQKHTACPSCGNTPQWTSTREAWDISILRQPCTVMVREEEVGGRGFLVPFLPPGGPGFDPDPVLAGDKGDSLGLTDQPA